MAEGKTSMFGKTYNTIGSTDSNFIIKTKGDLKVQWGNKYIDVIKNGKIASESTKILKKVDSLEGITSDGIYLVGDTVWAIIDGVKVQLSSNQEDIFVSFLTEQKDVTSDQKNLALTNIGFYYDTLEDAKSANIKAGLVYVKGDSKLYIIKDGIFSEYTINQQQSSEEIEEPSFEKLYISEYSLFVDGEAYATYQDNQIIIHKPIILEEALYSKGATSTFGYKLYMKDGESYLEIDHIIQRKDTMLITHSDLLNMIKNESLVPKKYYIIEDFQNPWEVSWPTEPLHYKDYYIEYNGEKKLGGIRNAMHLIVQAANYNVLEEYAWSLENPEWIIKYDVNYLGPEYKISDENIQYGFRSNSDEELVYLPCKGQITYLRDEYGNEGNFNFRQVMFEWNNSWRYCIDNTTEGLFGKFEESYNNKFYIEKLHINTQVFDFQEIKSGDVITGYNIKYKEDNVPISYGYKPRLQSNNIIKDNTINIVNFYTDEEPTIIRIIVAEQFTNNNIIEVCNNINITNSKFINNTFNNIYFEGSEIKITSDMENNILENILGSILIKGIMKNNHIKELASGLQVNIDCNNNIINKFTEETDLIIDGTIFDDNKIELLAYNISNTKEFTKNNIIECLGTIVNSGTFDNNIIDKVTERTVENTDTIKNNHILLIDADINNSQLIQDNYIESIINYFQNENDMEKNHIITIEDSGITFSMKNNHIEKILSVYGGTNGKLENSEVILLQETEISGAINNSVLGEIIATYIYKNINNCTIQYSKDSTINGDLSYNYIENLYSVQILNSFNNNKIKGYISETIFNGITQENIIIDNIDDCDLQDFNNNRIYNTFESVYATGKIEKCTFNDPIISLSCNTLINCEFDEINSLDLSDTVYYTSFHGLIGNPLKRELTDKDLELLKDSSKKKDAYPNIKVVCIPEIYIPGMIIMWHGNIDTIPEGWYLCDGNNGTPDLIGKFIKAGEEEGDNETDLYLQEGNMLTLDKSHLPKHSHPHNVHTHDISVNTYESTTDPEPISVVSNTQYVQDIQENFTDFVTGVEGEGVDNIITSQGIYKVDQNKDFVYSDNSGHSHNFSVSLDTPIISEVESKEIDDWEDPIAIKIEPAAYSLIFIMRGYDN